MSAKSIIPEVAAEAVNRRSFLKKIGIATTAVAAMGAVPAAEAQAGPTATDIAVLNFALNLEYLEAEFYTIATTGKTLQQFGLNFMTAKPGIITGGAQVTFTNSLIFTQAIALEIAQDERTHVSLLLSALGSQAINEPNIYLNALGFGFGNQSDFLKLARIFEDIGVSAYAGAAPLLSTAVVGTAARILAVEAEHVANIRLQIARLQIPTAPPLDPADILPPPSNPGQYFSVDSSALVVTRTPYEVLYLAYGGNLGVTSGGFFPNGANGSFVVSSGPAPLD